MHQLRVVQVDHVDAGVLELLAVGEAFVAQRVGGGDHDGVRVAGNVRVAQRRDAVIAHQGVVLDVMVVEPVDHVAVQPALAAAELGDRGHIRGAVGFRVHRHHQLGHGQPLERRLLGHHDGQIAAGAVAHGRQTPGVDAQVAGLLTEPAPGGDAVVGGGGRGVFRRQPVVHIQHHRAGDVGDVAAQAVVFHGAADGEAAAMEEHDRRAVLGGRALGAIQTHQHIAAFHRHADIPGQRHLLPVHVEHVDHVPVEGAALGQRQLVEALATVTQGQQQAQLGVQPLAADAFHHAGQPAGQGAGHFHQGPHRGALDLVLQGHGFSLIKPGVYFHQWTGVIPSPQANGPVIPGLFSR